MHPVKARYKWAPPCSLLSAGKAWKMGTKGVPAEIQKPEAVTPKTTDSSTLHLFISWYCHWKEVAVIAVVTVVVNRTTVPDDPPLLEISE